MKDKSLFSIPMLIAGALLLIAAGYFFVNGATPDGKSKLKIAFVDPASLTQLASMGTNRLVMEIQNPTNTRARIVGNSAC